jgi:hypothetical protein
MAVSRSGGAVIVVSYSWVAHSGMYNEREDAVHPRNGVADMVLSYSWVTAVCRKEYPA